MAQDFALLLKRNEFATGLANAFKIMGCKDNLSEVEDDLVSEVMEEGGKFHDKNQYSFIDCAFTRRYDPTDSNVLAPEQTPESTQKEIRVDNIRQIALTTDLLGLTGRAWGDEGSYSAYANLVRSQVEKAKKIYDKLFVETSIGTLESSVGKQTQTVKLFDDAPDDKPVDLEAKHRMNAQIIAKKITDIKAEIRQPTRDYTDIKYLDTFDSTKMTVIWNQDWLSKLNMIDLPTTYNDNYFSFNGKQMLASRFGAKISAAGTADGVNDRASNEYCIGVNASGEYAAPSAATKYVNVKPGDLLPKNTPVVAPGTDESYTAKDFTRTVLGKTVKYSVDLYTGVHGYKPDAKIICKIVALGEDVKYLSGLRTSGEFQNYKSNTTNMYTTFMFSEVEHLGGYPLITIKAQ